MALFLLNLNEICNMCIILNSHEFIIINKEKPPRGSLSATASRLTFGCKVEREAHEARKWRGHYTLEIYSALYRSELGPDAVEAFRLGDFVGWLIEE